MKLAMGALLAGATAQAPAVFASTAALNSSYSSNWAGYVADTANAYTAVGASWQVPAAGSSANNATDATWVGIGGVNSTDLIQAGTQAVVQNGSTQYQAWYELLPDFQQVVPLALNSGDSVTVSVVQKSSGIWHISIRDNTTGGDFEKDVAYQSSASSAEWIEERPVEESSGFGMTYLPLDSFGAVTFTGGYTVADGVGETIAGADAQPLTMLGGRAALATPSALSGDSFTVARTDTPAQQIAQATPVETNVTVYRSHGMHVRRYTIPGGGEVVIYFGSWTGHFR